jgi:hypothetical protein
VRGRTMASVSFKSADVAAQLLDCRLSKYNWYVGTEIAESDDECSLRVAIRVDDSVSKTQVLQSLGRGWLGFGVVIEDVSAAPRGDAGVVRAVA